MGLGVFVGAGVAVGSGVDVEVLVAATATAVGSAVWVSSTGAVVGVATTTGLPAQAEKINRPNPNNSHPTACLNQRGVFFITLSIMLVTPFDFKRSVLEPTVNFIDRP